MNYDLVKIEYQHDFILKVTFKDGTSGLVDFAKEINSLKPYNVLNDINNHRISLAFIYFLRKTIPKTEVTFRYRTKQEFN